METMKKDLMDKLNFEKEKVVQEKNEEIGTLQSNIEKIGVDK